MKMTNAEKKNRATERFIKKYSEQSGLSHALVWHCFRIGIIGMVTKQKRKPKE